MTDRHQGPAGALRHRPFRFGASLLHASPSREHWHARVRRVEDLGFDVLHVPDHIGMVAPFPALVSAAEVTRLRLGTYVINAGTAEPAYLAQEARNVHALTDGRLELGLGAGFLEADFTAAGKPFGSAASRVRRLDDVVVAVRDLLREGPEQPVPPIMVAGAGRKVLETGARYADIISFSVLANFGPGGPEDALADRIRHVRTVAGDRFEDIELNLFVAGVGAKASDVDLSAVIHAGKTVDELMKIPAVLVGAPEAIADRLVRYREQYGLSYISVLEEHAQAFAQVIPLLR